MRQEGSCPFEVPSRVPVTRSSGRSTFDQESAVQPRTPAPGGDSRRNAFGLGSAKLIGFAAAVFGPFGGVTEAPASSPAVYAP